MADDDTGKAWPPELVEFSIMAEVYRLAFILKFIITERPDARGCNDNHLRSAYDTLGRFEHLLDFARLPRDLDGTLRSTIRAFRRKPGPLPPDMVRCYHDRVIDCLLRDLPRLPVDADDYERRIAQLIGRHWIGDWARVIPRGWLPIVERAVKVGEVSIATGELAGVSTVFMGEKFGRLEWIPNGHRNRLAAISSYVRTATSIACMVCTRPGEGDAGTDRILTLCGSHAELRHLDEPAFRRAMYPGGPPDHPDVKL